MFRKKGLKKRRYGGGSNQKKPVSNKLHAQITQESGWQTTESTIKFSSALVVFLAIHIVVIFGLGAFWLKSKNEHSSKFKAKPKVIDKVISSRVTNIDDKEVSSDMGMDESNNVSKAKDSNLLNQAGRGSYNSDDLDGLDGLDGLERQFFYKIKAGDSLSLISKKFGINQDELLFLNNDVIKHKNFLEVGQAIKIPVNTGNKGYAVDNRVEKTLPGGKSYKKGEVFDDYSVAIPIPEYGESSLKRDLSNNIKYNDAKEYLSYPSSNGVVKRVKKSKKVASQKRYLVYKVKSGDSIFRIAKKFNVSQGMLIRVNGLKNPNTIYVGMNLKIPR